MSALKAQSHVAIFGAGPAGLMAADVLGAAGIAVTLYERMPSPARKFLIAGRGGLNLTKAEPLAQFVAHYGHAAPWLKPMIEGLPPDAVAAWAQGLGQETFVGSSGRVFPRSMKASPLLRSWLKRLEGRGVRLETRVSFEGFEGDALIIRTRTNERRLLRPDAAILALGGGSWARLGSDAAWTTAFAAAGIPVAPVRPANCGFKVRWSDHFRVQCAGSPLNGIALSHGVRRVRAEAVVTDYGLEGGAVYAISAPLRDAIAAHGPQTVHVDLRPEESVAALAARLARQRGGDSLTVRLRKALALSPVAINLLREGAGLALPAAPNDIAALVKAVPILVEGPHDLDRAISTAGGVMRDGVRPDLMLKTHPGIFVAGEMLDWEAPTGGYLLTAALATGAWAAHGVLGYLAGLSHPVGRHGTMAMDHPNRALER